MRSIPIFLIVDDDSDCRFLAGYALRKEFPGAEIIECDSVDAALSAAAAASRLAGILTDHHLGTAEGAAFIRDFRQRGANCPIVMVTANSDPNVHRRAYAAGAAHVFANGDYAFATYFRQALRESAL